MRDQIIHVTLKDFNLGSAALSPTTLSNFGLMVKVGQVSRPMPSSSGGNCEFYSEKIKLLQDKMSIVSLPSNQLPPSPTFPFFRILAQLFGSTGLKYGGEQSRNNLRDRINQLHKMSVTIFSKSGEGGPNRCNISNKSFGLGHKSRSQKIMSARKNVRHISNQSRRQQSAD
jgi:hypothetical protein